MLAALSARVGDEKQHKKNGAFRRAVSSDASCDLGLSEICVAPLDRSGRRFDLRAALPIEKIAPLAGLACLE